MPSLTNLFRGGFLLSNKRALGPLAIALLPILVTACGAPLASTQPFNAMKTQTLETSSHTASDKKVWAYSNRAGQPAGTLRIPRIDVKTPFGLGISDDVVRRGPGLWPGTPLPGSKGNSVFAGHRTTHTHPFRDLDLLRKGDDVITQVRGAAGVRFEVVRIKVVPETDYVDFVLRQPKQARARMITLFACAPKGSRTHRIVVQAKGARLAQRWGEDRGGRVNKTQLL